MTKLSLVSPIVLGILAFLEYGYATQPKAISLADLERECARNAKLKQSEKITFGETDSERTITEFDGDGNVVRRRVFRSDDNNSAEVLWKLHVEELCRIESGKAVELLSIMPPDTMFTRFAYYNTVEVQTRTWSRSGDLFSQDYFGYDSLGFLTVHVGVRFIPSLSVNNTDAELRCSTIETLERYEYDHAAHVRRLFQMNPKQLLEVRTEPYLHLGTGGKYFHGEEVYTAKGLRLSPDTIYTFNERGLPIEQRTKDGKLRTRYTYTYYE
jgi:hypothetical protein